MDKPKLSEKQAAEVKRLVLLFQSEWVQTMGCFILGLENFMTAEQIGSELLYCQAVFVADDLFNNSGGDPRVVGLFECVLRRRFELRHKMSVKAPTGVE